MVDSDAIADNLMRTFNTHGEPPARFHSAGAADSHKNHKRMTLDSLLDL
jgi:hypothetical protein